jgi:hypothetical protein
MSNVGRIVGALLLLFLGCTQPETVKDSASGGTSGVIGSGGVGETGGSGATGGAGQTGAGGSGQGTTTTQSALSGSRLKAYWVTASDGSQQFMGLWRDTQLNIDCGFRTGSDGQWRCLPAGMPGGAPYYSDSGCTTALGYTPCSSQAPAYVTVNATSGTGCSATNGSILYARGSQYTGTAYEGTPSACTIVPASTLSVYAFYTVGAAVDLTQFQVGSYGYQ